MPTAKILTSLLASHTLGPRSAMDHPKYHRYRASFLNAPDWQYMSSSDEDDDADDGDGLLTPVSMDRRTNLSASQSASAHRDSLFRRGNGKAFVIDSRQSKPCSRSSRRPITRSYGNDCVSLDYRRKGFVVYRPATKDISMTFERYLRHYDIERSSRSHQA